MIRGLLYGLVFLLCQACVLYLLAVWSLATARSPALLRLVEAAISREGPGRPLRDLAVGVLVPWTEAMTQPTVHLLMRQWDSERALRFLSWCASFRFVLVGWVAWIAPELLLPALLLLGLGAPLFAARVQTEEGAIDMDSVFIRKNVEAPLAGAVSEGVRVTGRALAMRLLPWSLAAALGGLLYASAPNDVAPWTEDGVGALALPLSMLGGALALILPIDLLGFAPVAFGLWAWQVPSCLLVCLGVGLELTSRRSAALAAPFLKEPNRLLFRRNGQVAVVVFSWFLGLYVALADLIFAAPD